MISRRFHGLAWQVVEYLLGSLTGIDGLALCSGFPRGVLLLAPSCMEIHVLCNT